MCLCMGFGGWPRVGGVGARVFGFGRFCYTSNHSPNSFCGLGSWLGVGDEEGECGCGSEGRLEDKGGRTIEGQ